MCTLLNGADRSLTSDHVSFESEDAATRSVNLITNGNFLQCRRLGTSLDDKVSCCLSTICALMKEFNSDWVAEGVNDRSELDQKNYLAYFGAYLELPLRTLSQLMKQIRWAGLRKSFGPFQEHLSKYLDYFKAADPRATALLIAYLATAVAAHDIWQSRQRVAKPLPWKMRINKKGTVLLVDYSYWTRGPKRGTLQRRSFTYRYQIDLPGTTADGVRQLFKMYSYGQRQSRKNFRDRP